MGQKLSSASGLSDIDDSDLNPALMKMKQEFVCPHCTNSRWTTPFSKPGVQQCSKCLRENIQGRVVLPKGQHLKGSFECKCKNNWEEDIEPNKMCRKKCGRCDRDCAPLYFKLAEGEKVEVDEIEKVVDDFQGGRNLIDEILVKDQTTPQSTNYEEKLSLVKDKIFAISLTIQESNSPENRRLLEDAKKEEAKWEELIKENKKKEKVTENTEDDEDSPLECKICYENNIDVCLLPCGHTICKACSDQVSQCPFDYKNITDRVQIFIS